MGPSGSFRYTALEEVVYGKPADQSLAFRVERMGAKRVFIIASGTLNRETESLQKHLKLLDKKQKERR